MWLVLRRTLVPFVLLAASPVSFFKKTRAKKEAVSWFGDSLIAF